MHYYEALATCLLPMVDDERFGVAQANEARKIAKRLCLAGAINYDIFANVVTKLGNHSAMRQWGIKHGFIPEKRAARLSSTRWPEDDLSVALKAAIAKRKDDLGDAAKK